MRSVLALLVLSVAVTFAERAEAIFVRLVPDVSEVVEGRDFRVELLADLDVPVLGWGLDFAASGPAALEGDPVIGPAWLPVDAPDGDGLAGVAFPDGIQGDGVLLATLRFTALAPGTVEILAGNTAGDLTEGFALDPSGFDSTPFFDRAIVTVKPVPEPSAGLLVLGGLAGLALRRRKRAQ